MKSKERVLGILENLRSYFKKIQSVAEQYLQYSAKTGNYSLESFQRLITTARFNHNGYGEV
jgi:hypothetical protein